MDGREIPYKEAKEATSRLYEQLTGVQHDPQGPNQPPTAEQKNKSRRFGIISVPCDGSGMTVETDAPELLPQEFEGIPVRPVPKVVYRLLGG